MDAPLRVTSAQLCEPLAATMQRLGLRPDVLASASGVVARRYWEPGVQPSQEATWAAEKVLADTQVPRDKIGLLVNTSVCRDFIEPSTACIVHGNLGLPLGLVRTPLGTLLVRGLNAFSAGAPRMAMARTRMPREVARAYTAPYDSWANRVATLRFVQDIPLRVGDPGFELVQATADKLGVFAQTPTFIGWGGKDFVFDDHFLAEWRAKLPHAHVVYLADAGHYVLEDAADELIPQIARFVTEG